MTETTPPANPEERPPDDEQRAADAAGTRPDDEAEANPAPEVPDIMKQSTA